MKYLEDLESQTGGASLEVYECDCGFHIGIDFTFLDQVEQDVVLTCPSCSDELTIGISMEDSEVRNLSQREYQIT